MKILLVCFLVLLSNIYSQNNTTDSNSTNTTTNSNTTTNTSTSNSNTVNSTSNTSSNSTKNNSSVYSTIVTSYTYIQNNTNLTNAINLTTLNQQIIPEIQAYITYNSSCFVNFQNFFIQMTVGEQYLWLSAYLSAQNNPTVNNNANRCFDPTIVIANLPLVQNGLMQAYSNALSQNVINQRNSLNCLKTVFTYYDKTSTAYQTSITDAVDAQSVANMCSAFYILNLGNILSSRRRFMLTTVQIQATAGYKTKGVFNGFTYTNAEAASIVSGYIAYQKCVSPLASVYTQAFTNVATLLGSNSACQLSSLRLLTENLRFLQSNSTTATVVNTTASNSSSYSSSGTSTTNLINGSITTSIQTSDTSAIWIDAPLTSQMNSLISRLNSTAQPIFISSSQAILQLNNPTSTFRNRADMINYFDGLLYTDLDVMVQEVYNINNTCNGTYQYVITNINTTGSNGYFSYSSNIGSNSYTSTSNTALQWKMTPFSQFYAAVGCINNARYNIAYTIDTTRGNFYQFAMNGFNTVYKSAVVETNCYSGYSAYGLNSQQFSTPASEIGVTFSNITGVPFNCIAPMQTDCQNRLLNSCSNSGLFATILNNYFLQYARALPNACIGADSDNPTQLAITRCLLFVDNYFISNTLFINLNYFAGPNVAVNINSNSVSSKRMLLNTAQTVANDPTANDSAAQIPASSSAASTNSVVIDSSTTSSQAVTSIQVNNVYTTNANSDYLKYKILFIIALIAVLLF